ncbi:MAG: ankyrin repeat domain-containing protein [Wolbachia endosymbiont of Tetragnatha montana]|nr:ankyrin repeat domain-containing protein [Wolbachia endosymbiont of Tetragnatha montana]
MVKSEEKYKVEVEGNAVFVVKGNVSAVLPMNYKNITVTFDQKEYYKLQGGKLERDYCSHRLKIDESFRVNSTDLLNYNCLTFDTDKVFFLRLGNDLQLVSNKEALSILDYYKPDSDASCTNGLLYIMGMEECTDSLDLSIELSNRIIEREEFRKRADNPSTFKYYEPGKVGLKIYHNQPVNKNDVGLVDLKGKFILDLDMEIIDDSLFLLHKNNTLVKVENWNTYQPAREMMFAFNDGVVFNAKCIVSSCGPEDTIREFQEKKVGFLNEYLLKAAENGNLDRVKYLLSRGAYIDARDHKGVTPLYFSCSRNHLDVVEFLLDQGANANAVANTWTPLQTATAHGFLKIVQLILNKRDDVDAKRALEVVGHFSKENESKIKNLLEERVRGNEETIQHHIRHKRHKQHHRKHLQKKGKTDAYRHRIIENDSSAIESNQATSGASKPSSWINVFANSVVDAVKSIRQFIFSSFKPAIDMQTSRAITTEGTDVNGTILLLDVFIRKFTGQKYISSNTRGITEQEALGYVLSVTEKFREVVEQAALKSSISIHRLNIDFMKIQEEITGKIISGKFNEISGILKSYAEKGCPGREAGCSGRLSQKKFDKFMTEFNSIIDPVINQPMQQILSRLKASNVKEQLSLEPRSYLNNASVQGHLTQDRDLRKQGKVLIP